MAGAGPPGIAQLLLATDLFAVIELDAEGRVAARHGALAEWLRPGLRAEDELPVLVGMDEDLREIAAGLRPPLHLPNLSWRGAPGGERFVSLHVLPGTAPGTVALLVSDTHEASLLRRQVMQQRNELELLRRDLERSNRALRAREAELREARDRAEEATRAKSRFLAVMSHEIRTPMNGVLGMLQLLCDVELPEEPAGWARTAHASAEALLQIINDILDFSKIEAGRVELERVAFDPRAVVEEALRLLGPQARAKGLALTARCAADLPPALLGDPGRLRQILLNLVGNGIKFTSAGQVCVGLARAADGALRVEVADTGIGIAAGSREHLFEEYSQADASTTRRYGGTGLGLAICRHLAKLMGGRIGVESELGRGSTFWVELPLAAAAGAPPAAPSAPTEPAAARPGARLLLADDSQTNREVARRMLTRAGYLVDEVVDGRAALEAVRARDYALVLMDVQMPVMDGLAATAALRDLGPRGALPIVAMTATAEHELDGDVEHYGFDAYVPKPFVRQKLLDTVARLVARGPKRRVAPPAAPAAAAPAPTAPAPARVEAPLDVEVLRDLAEGMGREAMPGLLEIFTRELRRWLDALPGDLAGARLDEVERQAHNVKANAGSLGAYALAREAEALEHSARARDGSACAAHARAIAPLAEAVLAALAELQRDL
jgi:signal transduction histidine kinase/CheY-like chemotaxis protein/HPt (histidine-containing phosphotransfer) domain-containing protein